MSVLAVDSEKSSDADHRRRQQVPANERDSIHEGRRRFFIPGGGSLGHRMLLVQQVAGQGQPKSRVPTEPA